MFGFFQNKNKETGPTEVTCPLCDHRQLESRLAVSSYCQKCGAYLSFEKSGEVKARPLNPPDPFANRPPQPEVVVDYSPRKDPKEIATVAPPKKTSDPEPVARLRKLVEPENDPGPPDDVSNSGEADEPVIQKDRATGTSRYRGVQPKKDTESPEKKIQTKEVQCFECGATDEANILANSSQCRSCGRFISMADHEIKETHQSPIQTRGNVHIHKKGLVRGAAIQCHDLIVEGDFTGDADCSGDLIIRRNGKISGKVRCRKLLVERRSKVEFLSNVEIDEGMIDGLVTGNLACQGLLALEKKAILTGNLKVGSLSMADGAKHNGQVRMGPF